MSFFSKRSLSKISLISGSIAAVLLTAGCDKTTTEPTEPAVVETSAVAVDTPTTIEAPTATAVASSASNDSGSAIMATLAADTLSNGVFGTLIKSDTLSAEQKTCLEARDKELGRPEIQAYYNTQFTPEELQELGDFYSSDRGKKMLAYANEQLLIMSGVEVAKPMPAPSEEDIKEFQVFMQSPLGIKNTQVNEAVGDDSMMGDVTPLLDAEFARCNIDIKMADIM